MAAVCGALADDVTITEVEFSLDVSKIDYFAGNFEGNVQNAISENISVANDAEYTLRDKSLCFVVGTGAKAVNSGAALIGANASREYLVFVTLTPKEGYTFSDTDYASISVKWNGSSVTPHRIYYNSSRKFIQVGVKLGAWATGTVATHTLTVANATYNSENFTGGSVAEGVTVKLTANTAATGYKFSGWNCTGITLDDATSNVAKFTMPANDVTIEATYVEQVVETLTAVTFTLPTDQIEYQIGVKEKTVSKNISAKITSESSDKYYIDKINTYLVYKNDRGSFLSINDETPIGSRTNFYEGKEQYYVWVRFLKRSNTIIFTPDASALTVTYNGKEVTPTQVEVKDNKQDLTIIIPLGDPAAATVTLYTLTCVNATPESRPYETFAGGDYAEGVSVTFRAKSPNTGEQFDHWEATGIELTEEQKTAEQLTITMPANAVTITAVYKKIDYKIIIADDIENGEVSVTSGAATANYNDEVALTVTPATGYELDVLEVKDASEGTVKVSSDYKFTMPNIHVKISATFKKVNYTITIASDIKNGEVSVTSGAATAQMGDEVSLTITPAAGYELDVLSVKDADNNDVTVSADYKFEMPASNVTVTATFKAVTPTALQTAELIGIYAENGRIYGTDGMQIFTLTGQNVTEMNGSLNGVYIVKVGESAQKVVVK